MITITEALSEINLVKKKIENADNLLKSILAHPAHVFDPYATHGGSAVMVRQGQQSVSDLRKRLLVLRSEISKANIEKQITINEKTMSIFDWLTWKREVYPMLERSLKEQIQTLKIIADKEASRPEVWKDAEGKTQLVTYVKNADLKSLEDDYNNLVDIYGKLDGQLSLKNATITILN